VLVAALFVLTAAAPQGSAVNLTPSFAGALSDAEQVPLIAPTHAQLRAEYNHLKDNLPSLGPHIALISIAATGLIVSSLVDLVAVISLITSGGAATVLIIGTCVLVASVFMLIVAVNTLRHTSAERQPLLDRMERIEIELMGPVPKEPKRERPADEARRDGPSPALRLATF
jgi:hypothetical protein